MPGPYYNQPYDDNRVAMGRLVGACLPPPVDTHSGLPVPRLRFASLDMLSTGALQDLIRDLAKGKKPSADKGIHRNEWGYLPGNRYEMVSSSKISTLLYGQPIELPYSACQFQEYFLANGDDLKMGKNADRRVVYDQHRKLIYLTMVHYDRWVEGTRNPDGSPKGKATTHNPFVQIIEIA